MSLHELTDDQREIRDLTRRFADEKIAPHAAQWDRDHHFPRELFTELGELGLMGVCVPEEHGGAGADFLAYVLVLEELSRADAGVGVTVAVHTSAGTLPILNHGSAEQIAELVPAARVRRGALRVRADRVRLAAPTPARCARGSTDDRITGAKQWITNGSFASTFIVFAKEDERPSAFLVRAGADGFSVTREEEKMGLNSSSTADLAFEDTPAERLGEPGNGMRVALRTLDGGRIGIAAQAVGIAQAAFELATSLRQGAQRVRRPDRPARRDPAQARRHADRDRGRPRPGVARRAAEGGRPPAHASRARRRSCSPPRVARRQTGEAIQILGGYGYTKEFPAERYYRDAKVTEIYEGTSEIQRLVIARALLGEAMRG